MEGEEARIEGERNYHKIFFTMAEKVDKLFAKYEKTIKHEKKQPDDYALVNHGGGGEEPHPSPNSSDNPPSSSSHNSTSIIGMHLKCHF